MGTAPTSSTPPSSAPAKTATSAVASINIDQDPEYIIGHIAAELGTRGTTTPEGLLKLLIDDEWKTVCSYVTHMGITHIEITDKTDRLQMRTWGRIYRCLLHHLRDG